MDRRGFLGLTASLAAAGETLAREVAQRIDGSAPRRFLGRKTGAHPFRARELAKRPHIILITLDMVTPDHYHPSRTLHRDMETPAIKGLLADGVFFSNAFCASPLCAPARATLATGRYSYITANGERAHDGHETILRPGDVIFPEYLRATGYITKHAGKGHLGTQKFMDAFGENDNAWDRWAPPVFDDEIYLSSLRRLGVKPQRYQRQILGLAQDRKTPLTSLGGWIEQADGRPFPLEAQYSQHLAERAIDKLDTALAEADGRAPIYLQLDFFDPHQPFSIPDGFDRRAAALRAAWHELPASYETARARDFGPAPDEPKIYGFYRKSWGFYQPETLREYRVANALQVEVVDRALGRLLGALKQRGIYDEALVVFTADHGEMNGRRALVDKGVYLFPDVLRVPLLIKPPASWGIKPRVVDSPVSHLDLAPTLLGVAGVEPEARLDGRSLMPLIDGSGAPCDRDLLFECGWHTGVNFACGVQRWDESGHYLYAYNLSSSVDELYDLTSPDAENLAQRSEHARLHAEMVRRLGAFVADDPRWRGYWHSLQVDHWADLPKAGLGDRQMFRPVP